MTNERPPTNLRRLLVTAGPTHEPIDAVRFIGNRSSGRLGIAIAERAAREGWSVRLLLGPTCLSTDDPRVSVRRFRTTADLQGLLGEEFPAADVLVMAAAVADFRLGAEGVSSGKYSRTDAGLTLHLEATPDLLAGCAAGRRPGQLLVGFALEPCERLIGAAREKFTRKGVDLLVANPLETMDAPTIQATVFARGGSGPVELTPGGEAMPKEEFAGWLLRLIEDRLGGVHGGPERSRSPETPSESDDS